MAPPSDVPASSVPALADVNSAMCAAALAAAAGSMSIESPYSSLLSGSSTTATMLPCAVGTGTTATIPSYRASVGS